MGKRSWGLLAGLAVLVLVSGDLLVSRSVQASAFSFNWLGTPTAPQPWQPGASNDWDLISNIDGQSDQTGAMNAVHGPACEAPPATHPISNLSDGVFICNNHLMTALNADSTAAATYGAIYFSPAQMLDFSSGAQSLSWKLSTQRQSARDWWQVNLTSFDQQIALPLPDIFPAYQGQPQNGLELRTDNGGCSNGSMGTILRVSQISNYAATERTQQYPCVEDQAPPSAAIRSQFQIDLSSNHLKVSMPGTAGVWYDGQISLPFSQAVVQFSHHSYNPPKASNPDGSTGTPNTWHWSDVNLSTAVPFTMLRPPMPHSLHAGQSPVLTLPQPAPANAHLRFAALGQISVSFDGAAAQAATPAAQENYAHGTVHPELNTSYWMPIPAGTSTVAFSGQPTVYGGAWWLEDAAVWAPGLVGPTPTPTATPTPIATATPTPTPTPTATPTPTPTPSGPLVGDSRVESNVDGNTPGQAQAYPYTATASGLAGHLSLYVDASNHAASINLGLYSNSGSNQPQSLLAQCSISSPVAGWNSCALSMPAAVVSGTKYWLAILGPTGTGSIAYRDSVSSATTYGSASASLATLPASWSSGPTWGSAPASVYASS